MKKQTQYFMAVDQYGQTEHGLVHPRKDLMERHRTKHADKIYQDKRDGGTVHVGYIVRGRWFTVYAVQRMEKPF